MKTLLAALALLVLLTLGCTAVSFDAQRTAQLNPQIQDFLADYPNATSRVTLASSNYIAQNDNFESNCPGVELKDYWRAEFAQENTGNRAVAFIDTDTQQVVCVFVQRTEITPPLILPDDACIEIWECGEWYPSYCPANREQLRTCTDLNDCGTTVHRPALTRTCVPQNCTPDWSCADWTQCVNNIQHRTCTDSNECQTNENKPVETRTCGTGCDPDWTCTDWTGCTNFFQTRSCTDQNECNTTIGKPAESQNCQWVGTSDP